MRVNLSNISHMDCKVSWICFTCFLLEVLLWDAMELQTLKIRLIKVKKSVKGGFVYRWLLEDSCIS